MGKKFFIKSLFIILSVYTLPNFAYAQKSEMDLTYDMFLQIKEEMTYEQVVGIIGHEGELISEAVAGTQTSKYYRWIYKKNKVIKHIMIMFMNDQVFVKQQYGLNQAEKSEPVIVAEPPAKKENDPVVQPSPKVEVKTSPPKATAKTPRRFNYGTFWPCQTQTVQGCKKSRYVYNKRLVFSSNGLGKYYFVSEPQPGKYKSITVKFNWIQKGNVAYLSNKSSTYISLKGDIKTSETFSGDSFEFADDDIIKSDTGIIYLRK